MTLPSKLTTLDACIAHHARATPEREVAIFGDARLTYGACERRVAGLADALRAEGVQPGDRVAVLSTPRPEYLVALNGILRAGGIYVGLNPRHTAPELAHALRVTRPSRILALDQALGLASVAALRSACHDAGLAPPIDVFSSLDDLPGSEARAGALPPIRRTQDVAVIVFTSGTTGRPKGAALHHGGLLTAARVQWEHIDVGEQRALSNLPINHVGAILNLTYGILIGGGTLIFQEKFDPAEALRLIERERATVWLQVPAMFQMATSLPNFGSTDLSSLQAICIGGGAPSMPMLAALRQTGARLYVEYGQTETMSTLAFAVQGATDEDLCTSIGRFDPRFEVRIADTDNLAVTPGVVGEIQARGDCVMRGYWGDEESTRAAHTSDGWLKTGDLALSRTDGLVELKGRLSEMIKSGGYNLYPREIEMVLEAHPAVAEVAVVGCPDAVFGEAAYAIVNAREPVTSEALKAWCGKSLANYKTPRSFRAIDTLPRLPNGKIDRASLKGVADRLSTLP